MSNYHLAQAYEKTRSGIAISAAEAEGILVDQRDECALGSLATLILCRDSRMSDATILKRILSECELVRAYLSRLFPLSGLVSESSTQTVNEDMVDVLRRTQRREELGRNGIRVILDGLSTHEVPLAIWLMLVCERGLFPSDLDYLTLAMRDSGQVYDYRGAVDERRLVRRYPTGALSEKVALILPSLLLAVADEYPIASPFMVARSLSFTGGTWDKLSSIPGFRFPRQGPETQEMLRASHVAMCVTEDECCPADRLMYQLRSRTGTVPSPDLAVASIASKHLAVPVDVMLLDVRWGEGAFFHDRQEAGMLARGIEDRLRNGRIDCFSMFREMRQPDGMAIGNACEVAEAVAVMNGGDPVGLWDRRAIADQRGVVLSFFAELMTRVVGRESGYWLRAGDTRFSEGTVLGAFQRLLACHGVSSDVASTVCNDPMRILQLSDTPGSVVSPQAGRLNSVDQRKLGAAVNFSLLRGRDSRIGSLGHGGVVLRKRIGDTVSVGDELCRIYPPQEMASVPAGLTTELLACFQIGPSRKARISTASMR